MTYQSMSSPVQWVGGKGIIGSWIVSHFTQHQQFIDVFGGGASVILAKPPSAIEVYNDLDEGLVNFWRVVRDWPKFNELQHRIKLTPYSRQEFEEAKTNWASQTDEIDRAFQWFLVARMSFSGDFNAGWSHSVGMSRRGMAGAVSRYLSAIEMLPAVHLRFMRVQIEHSDFRMILRRYDSPDTLFYCDPPYIQETRKSTRYRVEMTNTDHEEMVSMLLGLKGKAVLSGYRHPIYEPLETAGWARHDLLTSCYAAGRTAASGLQGEGNALRMQERTESVWVSPHDGVQMTFDFGGNE